MTASKSLPARPSLDSLRKQAKKLARDVASGDHDAVARVRAHLPRVDLPLTQRNAQLVVAREYGFAGWTDLTADVNKRLGSSLDWAIAQARRVIHDNDVEALKQLLAEHPALLTWLGNGQDNGGVLGFATGSYGDAFEPFREQQFTRAACAELLIDRGAVVLPAVPDGILQARARGLLQLFERKGLLPHMLKFLAALGDLDRVRAHLAQHSSDLPTVTDAFVSACSFEQESVASLLLDRAIALNNDLGRHVDDSVGRPAFIKYFIEKRPSHAIEIGLWKALVLDQIRRAILDDDLTAFVGGLQRERWLLEDASVSFQRELIESATLNDREEFIRALFDLDPAILRRQPPPQSQAIEFAFSYDHTHLLPLVTRIWPVPDDLPHAAGLGDLARVQRWFDGVTAPPQQVLDLAFAYAVINRHLDVADFLLAHGANINTDWSSHEPASLLHELTFHDNYESMRFLIERGIDMAKKDYRWNSNAAGWARYAEKDEQKALWLEAAERARAAGDPLPHRPSSL